MQYSDAFGTVVELTKAERLQSRDSSMTQCASSTLTAFSARNADLSPAVP